MPKDRIVHQALLYHKGETSKGSDDAGQYEGFECAHMVGHEHAGAFKCEEVICACDFDAHSHMLQGMKNFQAARTPCCTVVEGPFCLGACPEYNGKEVRI